MMAGEMVEFHIGVVCSLRDARGPEDVIAAVPLFKGKTLISYDMVTRNGPEAVTDMECRMLAKALLYTIQEGESGKPMTEDELFEKMRGVRDRFRVALDENGWEENEAEAEGDDK